MIYDVIITDQALADMKMIYEHIANTLIEPIIAEKQYTRIEKAIYSLDYMPERFRRYEKEPWRSRNLRVLPIDSYLAFHIVDNEKLKVTVMRILYSKRDVEKVLGDMAKQDD